MLFDLLDSLFGVAAVGAFLSLAFLFPEKDGLLTSASQRLTAKLPILILAWLISAIGNLLATLANLFELSILGVLDLTIIRSYVTQTSLGKLQLFQVVATLLLLIFAKIIKKTGGAFLAYLLSISALIAPIFQSHSSQAGSHGLAIGSLIIHVIALSTWVGAVASLIFMENEVRKFALSRISVIAMWSVATVVISGVINSLLRLGLSDAWLTTYGLLIIGKIALLSLVAILAIRMRRNLKSNLIKFEILVLALIIGIGAILSRFTPIVESELGYDPIRELVGVAMPAQPNWQRLIFEYEADALMLGILVFATALYIKGVVI